MRKNPKSLVKITAGILMLFLVMEGVSASDEGLVAYWGNDYGTATE